MKTQTDYNRAVLTLSLAAGLLYNSWPLGYLLDSQTAHSGLASDLELVGHPYYWLFILGDVLTAVCLVAMILVLRFRVWKVLPPDTRTWLAAGLVVFGLFTAISALLPYNCTVTPLLRCGAGHGTGLGLDAVVSSIAALGLFVSLLSLAFSRKLNSSLQRLNLAILGAWLASALVFVGFALRRANQAHFPQDVLMILSGAAIFVIGLNIIQSGEKK
jgi:hypothetical protein